MQIMIAIRAMMKAGRENAMNIELCMLDHFTGFLFAGNGYSVTKPIVVRATMYVTIAKTLLFPNERQKTGPS